MSANPDSPGGHTAELADGHRIPSLALGVWQVTDAAECVRAVRWALELGYRHIDTAQAYGNEENVGRALADSGVPREEVFVTTKFLPSNGDPVAAAEASLRRLGLDYLDLYLIHWPEGGPTWAWPGMEKARALGYARSVGVSNFGAADLSAVTAMAEVPPVVDQISFSPVDNRGGVLAAAAGHGMVVEAYSPLGTGAYLANPVVREIADRVGRTPAQVLLRWCLQRGTVVLPKSTHRERIEENSRIFDFTLADADMAALGALDQTGNADTALDSPWW